ncbi:Uncharacterized protein APZ42_030293 [Daphnia magna]|uniref:Uncharacterized protein n=1 Tax=Daphnia magna TaxID=35525 RepID=A0A164NXM6_9CRUS|nr:Uncharacterized protein APZ42_030293 [Daphnia magna]
MISWMYIYNKQFNTSILRLCFGKCNLLICLGLNVPQFFFKA